jgi:hypothetical protein
MSLLVADGINDFVFSIQIIVKIYMMLLAGIVVGFCVKRTPRALFAVLVLQAILILISMLYDDFYRLLLLTISPSAKNVFSEIYGQRSLGFGLYHVDGSVQYAILCLLPLVYSISYSKLEVVFSIVLSFVSLTLGRSAIIILILFLLIRMPFITLLVSVVMLVASAYVTQDWGAVFSALEPFRNLYETGIFFTQSTNQNLDMFLYPDDLNSWLFGGGKFFESDGVFYMGTDIGWSRLLLFGGIPFMSLFIVINNVFNLKVYNISKSASYIIFAAFVILNFKTIYVSLFPIGILLSLQMSSKLQGDRLGHMLSNGKINHLL